MTEINLLPWREQRREQEKKQFTMLASIVLMAVALCVFMTNRYIVDLVDAQTGRNERLQREIVILEAEIKEIKDLKKLRAGLIARMTIVQNLQATRVLTVRLFDELISILPDGVFLTKVQREKDKITLLGYTDSNSNVSQLMRRIEASNLIQRPELTEIKKTADDQSTQIKKEDQAGTEDEANAFKLSFILKPKDGLIH